jgi:hypothetical protein
LSLMNSVTRLFISRILFAIVVVLQILKSPQKLHYAQSKFTNMFKKSTVR